MGSVLSYINWVLAAILERHSHQLSHCTLHHLEKKPPNTLLPPLPSQQRTKEHIASLKHENASEQTGLPRDKPGYNLPRRTNAAIHSLRPCVLLSVHSPPAKSQKPQGKKIEPLLLHISICSRSTKKCKATVSTLPAPTHTILNIKG